MDTRGRSAALSLWVSFIGLWLLTGCGADGASLRLPSPPGGGTTGNGGGPTIPVPPIVVTVAPATTTLTAGQTQTFTATITGTSNSEVSWLINGVAGGDPGLGTITSAGSYTAPTPIPISTITVTAVSSFDSSHSGSATVTFSSPAPSPAPLPGVDYYVSTSGNDGNDGSFGHPWATIQHAADVIDGGKIVHVSSGSYTGPITTSRNGTANARIRFISDLQGGARIRTTASYSVWTNNGDYVDIVGFDIAGDSTSCLGIVNWASFVRIMGNAVHDIPAPGGCNGNGGAGIDNANFSAGDDDVVGNVVHDIGDYNNPTPTVHGIYHSNLRGHIWNNIAYRNQGWGIHLWHTPSSVTVSSNTIFHNGYGGILVGGDTATDDHSVVTDNIVVFNGGIGISEYGRTGLNNIYKNNVVYQNASGAFALLNGLQALGTVAADPQFVNYQPDGSGDYHLQSTSPAIGAATSQGAPSFDFSGAPRPQSSRWDAGAVQWNSPPGTWPWY